ncbi:MAG: hypothetical protein ACRCSN_19155, partial [Dermatophilaceae bacterium]
LQASAPAQAAGVCGANYNPVRSVNVDIIDGPRQTLSKISVQYNPDNGYWCAVNRNSTGNDASRMSVSIKRPNEGWNAATSDSGPFKEFAGPVYRYWDSGTCIDVRGSTIVNEVAAASGDTRVCR